ncbi:Di-copper centre-containing protein [Plenodomus tracheiphilus IPT5]|uniref:Di-copper centre-containing protein n=1 Tax=Plenodomus tracheiphilus IPT5 TaxID=1408161 RepID=A0A6A7ARS2_9PLEO|nr:Di-copper centre-containing protein [Plenodomus tracheiphilus IPT5]
MFSSSKLLAFFIAEAHFLSATALPSKKTTSSSCSQPTVSAPNETISSKCSRPIVRKEWRTLDIAEQDAYINAIQCLKTAPSRGTTFYDTLQSRYDDFVALHINATRGGDHPPSLNSFQTNSTEPVTPLYSIHGVGIFLPWHRYVISIFESTLRSECNYTGAQPYWDWTLDSPASNSTLLASPVFQAFGGNGSATTGCVEYGPFAGTATLNIGPGDSMKKNPRCMTRIIQQDLFDFRSNWSDIFEPLLQLKKYVQVQLFIDELDFLKPEDQIETFAKPHGLMHSVIGGDFMDVLASPNDPIFWLHHTFLDYLWALWQQCDAARLHDIGGARTTRGLGPEGDKIENTTLDTPLWTGFVASDVPVGKIMDTMNGDGEGVLCYKYEDSPSTVGRSGF